MELKIYYRDTDCGGVVYYANYLDYFERARTEWFGSRGVSIIELKDRGIQFVVKHAEVDYKSPAVYGDIINILTEAESISPLRIYFTYKVLDKITGRLLVTGKTELVCVNDRMKPCRLSSDIIEKLTLSE